MPESHCNPQCMKCESKLPPSVKWPTYLMRRACAELSRHPKPLARASSPLSWLDLAAATGCRTPWLVPTAREELHVEMKLPGELQQWRCSCLSWNSLRCQGTSFLLLLSILGIRIQVIQLKTMQIWDGIKVSLGKVVFFPLQSSTWLLRFWFYVKKLSYQFQSSLTMYHPLIWNHIHGWEWLCRHKEGKDSTYKYIIIYSLKAFILMQNKPGKIYIAICNKRSKSLKWY